MLTDVLPSEIVEYLQRLFGYALTGTGKEHVLPILIGGGRNGKSTIVEAIAHAIGPYATSAAPSTFMNGPKSSIRNDVASLHGAWLIRMSELNAGQTLDAALVKQFTGGDLISARRLYGEFFEFNPNSLVVMLTNVAPVFDGSDQGLARRVQFVPFDRVVAMDDFDTDLPSKLRAEAPGIIKWLLRGCLDYYWRGGLQPPASMIEAKNAVLHEANQVLQFVEDCCVVEDGASCGSGPLYDAYRVWASLSGLKPMIQSAFNPQLERTSAVKRRRISEGVS